MDDHLGRVGVVGEFDAKGEPADCVGLDIWFASALFTPHGPRLTRTPAAA
jgi:hypothetical protein